MMNHALMQPTSSASSIMLNFATATGLTVSSHKPRRYLWTDAFAVCNFLGLYRKTGESAFLELALKLVDQVHQVLGRYRSGDRSGEWISGLDEVQARQHPTRGGLRIGKRLDEPRPGVAVDESSHWEQDGQYFHYLTKWMHALNCVGRDTGEAVYNQWALELAKVAHSAFTYTPQAGRARRMYWKMSVDLSRPLVTSMGHADPLDGLLTYQQLQSTGKSPPDRSTYPDLRTEIEEMAAMCAGRSWATDDALGIGGLLTDAYKLVQLIDFYQWDESRRLETLLHDIATSLNVFFARKPLDLGAQYRLAFRELGLAIGLFAIPGMQSRIQQHPESFSGTDTLIPLLEKLSQYHHLHELIQDFWLEPGHQSVRGWREHADINSVMLATSLEPQGYLEL